MVTAAEKLDKSVNTICLNLQRLCDKKDHVHKKEQRLYKA